MLLALLAQKRKCKVEGKEQTIDCTDFFKKSHRHHYYLAIMMITYYLQITDRTSNDGRI